VGALAEQYWKLPSFAVLFRKPSRGRAADCDHRGGQDFFMHDLNNRPGGPNLIVTGVIRNRFHFLFFSSL